jgi:membrane-associated phospholipid phosphatase
VWLALALAVPFQVGPLEVGRVPIAENFGDGELLGLYALVTAEVAGLVFEEPLVSARGAPAIGDPWGWDRDVSEALYRGPGTDRFLEGVPDVFGMAIAPALTLGTYGLNGFAGHFADPLWGRNSDHELLALVEAYAVTLGLTQAAKVGIGRERPEYELGRGERPSGRDPERTLSFFSGHSSSSFCLAAFVSRDLGDWLIAYQGAGVVTGRVLPSVALYGAAGVVAASRIIDQKHYLTDVAVGSIVGATAGNLFYALHFDGAGRPRRRAPGRVSILAYPTGISISGRF